MRFAILGGDTMLGRGVSPSLPFHSPGDEDLAGSLDHASLALHCDQVSDDALEELRRVNSDGSYLWGDYLTMQLDPPPDIRFMSLETAATATINNRDIPFVKGLLYHCHISNLTGAILNRFAGIAAAAPYVITLANNHSMDLGRAAFASETVPGLRNGLPGSGHIVGGGLNATEAGRVCEVGHVRILGCTTECAGTPHDWMATNDRAGLLVLPFLGSEEAVEESVSTIATLFGPAKGPQEIRVLSIHWGPNWAYRDGHDDGQAFRRALAHAVVSRAGVDVVHGHSSHHIRGFEAWRGKLIIYGAGDFIDDHEGFKKDGDEQYCVLGAVTVVDLDDGGDVTRVMLVPTCVDKLHVRRVTRGMMMWNPWTKMEEEREDGVGELCDAINALSVRDCESPMVFSVDDEHPAAPGGAVIVWDVVQS